MCVFEIKDLFRFPLNLSESNKGFCCHRYIQYVKPFQCSRNAVQTAFVIRHLLLFKLGGCWLAAAILRNFHRIMQYSGANVDYTQNALPLNSVTALFLPYQISFFTAFMVCICLPQSLSPPHWKTCLTPLNRSPGSRVLWCCKGRVRISIFPSMVQYMHHITHHRHRKRFADLNLKTNLIHTIFMRSDFMPGRFVCTTDDNTAVIMQVQFPREYNPRVFTLYACFNPYDIKEA